MEHTENENKPAGAPSALNAGLDAPKLSMQTMCEYIAESGLLIKQDGTAPTPLEIFNSSPTGELFQVFEWYDMAKVLMESKVSNIGANSASASGAKYGD